MDSSDVVSLGINDLMRKITNGVMEEAQLAPGKWRVSVLPDDPSCYVRDFTIVLDGTLDIFMLGEGIPLGLPPSLCWDDVGWWLGHA